ncbi:MAG: DUF692 domain-containing protein [Pseudomonadales bacterium]|nr:DUF692 domain-containing protein [Pseudomonadales bacterium]
MTTNLPFNSNAPTLEVGLGLRRAMMPDIHDNPIEGVGFFEVAPENWINIGGRFGRQLRQCSERNPLYCHGLSLSIGGTAPLNVALLKEIKTFLTLHQSPVYSEHLSYTGDDGQLYDLLPLPFTEEAVHHVAKRIRQAQDILERKIAIENVSYYLVPQQTMSEADFLCAVLEEADCDLLLDVNNVYVNSVNHNYDALQFLQLMPAERVSYLHIAGHFVEPDGVIIDTHGADIVDPVWALLDETYHLMGLRPTLLERDFNLPELQELHLEVAQIQKAQQQFSTQSKSGNLVGHTQQLNFHDITRKEEHESTNLSS